eukprot:scaffold659_cov182-Pinguiococcus_pyrenoidosus.AAC.1
MVEVAEKAWRRGERTRNEMRAPTETSFSREEGKREEQRSGAAGKGRISKRRRDTTPMQNC